MARLSESQVFWELDALLTSTHGYHHRPDVLDLGRLHSEFLRRFGRIRPHEVCRCVLADMVRRHTIPAEVMAMANVLPPPRRPALAA